MQRAPLGEDLGAVPQGAGARTLTLGSTGGDSGGALDVKFSDDRFLRRVLQEAQRGSSTASDAAVKRLQGMGFGPEVVRVAMHVTGGDERRALELCMSGLAFVGSTAAAGGAEAPLVDRVPLTPLRCYICGQRHLTAKSLDIHVKACGRRFEQREAKRPPQERRRLLEASELPEGAECLERHYELTSWPREPEPEFSEACGEADGWGANKTAGSPILALKIELLPCEFCKRTFAPDRLDTHQKVCLQRPRPEPAVLATAAAAQRRRRQPAARGDLSPPPAAALRSYENFCSQLERCPGCSRQFRPDALQAHARQCAPLRAKKEPARLSVGGGARSPQPRRLAAPPCTGRTSLPGGSPVAKAPSVAAAASRRSRSQSSLACSAAASPQVPSFAVPGSASPGPLSFAPPGRQAPGSATPGPVAQLGVEASLQSSAALVARGYINPASPDMEARLRLQLLERLPGADFLGAYRVTDRSHLNMYDALRTIMQDPREGQLPLEKELWHGTAWATVPKILRQGFNRSFAGRHGTLLGVATYFSTDPAYSQRFCDRRGGGRDGTKAMLLSSVLVGKYCKGAATDVEPPVRDVETGERYDSTVDNEDRPGIFAVFRDFQAVPLFLVEFRTGGPATDKKLGTC